MSDLLEYPRTCTKPSSEEYELRCGQDHVSHVRRKPKNSYGVRRVGLRHDIFNTFDNGVDRRFKEVFYLVPEGGISHWTSSASEDTTHPGKLSFPLFTPQRASLSHREPNFTNWGLLLSEKASFNPVSKLSVKAARSCSLSNLDFLSFARQEKT